MTSDTKTIWFLCGGVLIVSLAVGAWSSLAAGPWDVEGLQPFNGEAFINPDVCGRCHDDIFDMWSGTMHSKAFMDPLFRAATKRFIAETATDGERADAEHCVACHNPIAYRSGQIPGTSADYEKVNDVTKHSISCDLCHTIIEIVEPRNASFNTEPGKGEDDPGTKRGPRDDPEPMYHESAFSKIHVSSEICGGCHNVTHLAYKTKLESTYDEWLQSPYNNADEKLSIDCQDCHMRQTSGHPSTGMTDRPDFPGKSTPMGKERPHIFRHTVIGGNAYLPPMLGSPGLAELAVERLQKAAILELREVAKDADGQWAFTVRVKNEGAGHMLPTGVSEYRQMWLDVTVTDAGGKVVYTSGELGAEGALLADTRIFNTVFGDSKGIPTMNVARAAVMLSDHRVPPKGYLDERFTLSRQPSMPCTVHVVLRYRSLDPSVARLLLGNDAPPVPVIDMTVLEQQVR